MSSKIHADNPLILRDNTNHELQSVLKLTKANKITANPKKSSALTIHPLKNHQSYLNNQNTVPFNNNPVSANKPVKYWGITIDEKLNFAQHIVNATCKIFRSSRYFN